MIVCSDSVSDLGVIAEQNGFGYKANSKSVENFESCVCRIRKADISEMGDRARAYLEARATADIAYKAVLNGEK